MIKDEAWKKEKEAIVASYAEKNREIEPGGTVFCGSSLTERFPVEEWTGGKVVNRGVGGYTIAEYARVIDICCTDLRPSKVFISIGSNDLNDETSDTKRLISDYRKLLSDIMDAVPGVRLYVMAYYPVNDDTDDEFMKEELKYRTNEVIDRANAMIRAMCDDIGAVYIDVNSPLKDKNSKLVKKYSVDGVHIDEKGYKIVFEVLKKHIEK